ncbi:hypothetical protein BH20CHL7_BH20CHL7_12570 [soil metagenome]
MDDATVLLHADGTYADASPAALEILGVTLDELLAMAPGAFAVDDPDPAADFRKWWESEGSPTIGGQATIRRPDGQQRRVAFQIPPHDDGRFLAILRDTADEREAAPVFYTAGDVLAEWRAAERRLETLDEGSPEWTAIRSEIDSFRGAYQRAFRSRNRGGAV